MVVLHEVRTVSTSTNQPFCFELTGFLPTLRVNFWTQHPLWPSNKTLDVAQSWLVCLYDSFVVYYPLVLRGTGKWTGSLDKQKWWLVDWFLWNKLTKWKDSEKKCVKFVFLYLEGFLFVYCFSTGNHGASGSKYSRESNLRPIQRSIDIWVNFFF